MAASPDKILDSIPAWQGAIAKPLDGGLTNTSFKVSKDGRTAVLKIDDAPRNEPLNTRRAEAIVQTMAAKAGLAAAVISANEEYFFCEYLEGTVCTRSCFDEEGMLELVGRSLQRLHSLPLTGRIFDASIAAERYVANNNVLDASVVSECLAIIENIGRPQDLCCCHNDLVAGNIIATPDVKFLDWEYACDNDLFFDLATIVEHHQLGNAQTAQLLDVYFDGNGTSGRIELDRQRQLYLALLCLWTASRPECDADELRGVVERLITSCF